MAVAQETTQNFNICLDISENFLNSPELEAKHLNEFVYLTISNQIWIALLIFANLETDQKQCKASTHHYIKYAVLC